MPKLDDFLREELHSAAPRVAPPDDIFQRLDGRKRHRRVVRRATSAALAVAVLAASAGAFIALDRAFTGTEDEIANPPALPENGDLFVTVPDDGGSHIFRLPAASIPGPDGRVATQEDLENVWFKEGPADQHGASVSPDGLTVVFEDPAVEGSTLWSVGIDGSDATRLTPPSMDASQPAWSPDGQWIAFVGSEASDERVFVMRPDGSQPTAVTDTEVLFPAGPTWAPDGTRIAFTAVEGPVTDMGPRSIYTVSADGTGLVGLDLPAEEVGNSVAWSPDGNWIAYTDTGIKLLHLETGEVTTLTDAVAEGLPGAETGDAYDADPAWSPDGTLVVFSRFERVDESVVYAVGADGSGLPYPLVVGRDPAWQPLPSAPPSPGPTEGELGLGFEVCRVTSMPIATASGGGTAWVFTKASADGCPKANEGFNGVAVDVDGDGAADASYGPLDDCFMQCEAFAAPDVDADGVSELAVSTQGADGYGVWLFWLARDHPQIVPVVVEDPDGIGYVSEGNLQFAWAGAAAHREDALCQTGADGQEFVVRSTDVNLSDATQRTTTMVVSGAVATVIGADEQIIPLEDAPGPGNEFCGSPLYNSAANFPGAQIEGHDIGLDGNLCQMERLGGLELVPGAPADVAWTGYLVNAQGKCSENTEAQEWVVAVDATGDGLADASTAIPDRNCPYVWCAPLGGTDLDADGDQELIVNTFFSIIDHTYFAIEQTDAGVTVAPIFVAAPGNPAAAIEPGEPLHTSAAGDAGFAGWIRCEGYPESPVLVATWSNWPIESDLPREWHETKLQLQADGMFHVISTNDFELPWDQDPGLIRSDEPACGINFNFWANPPE